MGIFHAKDTENLCAENFDRMTNRSLDGKYVLSLPFKDSEHINKDTYETKAHHTVFKPESTTTNLTA